MTDSPADHCCSSMVVRLKYVTEPGSAVADKGQNHMILWMHTFASYENVDFILLQLQSSCSRFHSIPYHSIHSIWRAVLQRKPTKTLFESKVKCQRIFISSHNECFVWRMMYVVCSDVCAKKNKCFKFQISQRNLTIGFIDFPQNSG